MACSKGGHELITIGVEMEIWEQIVERVGFYKLNEAVRLDDGDFLHDVNIIQEKLVGVVTNNTRRGGGREGNYGPN